VSRIDARLLEMQFLARLERDGKIDITGPDDETAERRMIRSLLVDGYLNDGFDELRGLDVSIQHELLNRQRWVIGSHIRNVITGKPMTLKISHRGRVRLSELEQQLKTGRDRDETGLLWAKRHVLVDLAIAILSASQDAPLSVAFLDMNGLKAINDTHGHAAGDQAIRSFFQAAVATLGARGEAYRNGGDEVVVILPGVGDEEAGKLLDGFARQLGKDVVVLGDARAEARLTASCGSASTTNPSADAEALLKLADAAQYGAKAESKKHDPRVSTFAVGGRAVTTHAPGT